MAFGSRAPKGSTKRIDGMAAMSQSQLPPEAVPQVRPARDEPLPQVIAPPAPDPRTVVSPQEQDMSLYTIPNSATQVEFELQATEAAITQKPPPQQPSKKQQPLKRGGGGPAQFVVPKWAIILGGVVLAIIVLALGIYVGAKVRRQ